ncbi:MAG: transcriptional repressor LexA [Gammaproteobacteria bacterium]|nr:transcriptional repressor LexA [Gammaproteobacteria bacterium]MDP2139199.1 transcriptional repressor LexA [Gammaproteobacteria bacterium]MDP2349032.1 transcriptional repressor LexA [Gammaproteobacteria bacterium]
MINLTPRQAEILEYIREYQQETGFPPTRSEIARKMGFKSPNAAEEHLRALEKKGAIEMLPGTSRGIRLPALENVGLPIVGQVAAGSPILAIESIDDYCDIPPDFFHPRADFLLTVKGSSMIKIGIHDGDLLAVHKTNQANDGDIIVARIDEDVTVKRLLRGRNKSSLQLIAENDDFAPIEVDLRTQQFTIEGISVGVIRRSI